MVAELLSQTVSEYLGHEVKPFEHVTVHWSHLYTCKLLGLNKSCLYGLSSTNTVWNWQMVSGIDTQRQDELQCINEHGHERIITMLMASGSCSMMMCGRGVMCWVFTHRDRRGCSGWGPVCLLAACTHKTWMTLPTSQKSKTLHFLETF